MFDFGLYTQVSDSGPHGPLVVECACGERDTVVTTSVWCICIVHACLGLGHNLNIFAWISKLFGTVVLVEE